MKFQEAIDFAKTRGVTLPSIYYGQLQGQARAQAFTVSYLQSVQQILGVLTSLNNALENGQTLENWKTQLSGRAAMLTDAHLETVFRNAMMTAYNVGRWRQFERNKENRPMLMYDAVNDNRTRPTHARMDGFIAPIDSTIWDSWCPPSGHNCRCHLVSLTEPQAKARGGARSQVPLDDTNVAVQPDDGWDYNPYKKQSQPMAQQPAVLQLQKKQAEIKTIYPMIFAAIGAVLGTILGASEDAENQDSN